MKITRFQDIPQFVGHGAAYEVDYSWDHFEEYISRLQERGLNLTPDFQRVHVWTEQQQVAFVEYMLRGGESGRHLYFNFPGFAAGHDPDPKNPRIGEFVVVDGKQRIEAALRFLRNQVPVFGSYYREFTDRMTFHVKFRIVINNLRTRSDVLQWYLGLNAGGTPHSPEEIQRVRLLLAKEEGY